MFKYQFINHPESFVLDDSRIARVFELVSRVPPVSVIARLEPAPPENGEAIQVSKRGTTGSFVPQDDGHGQNAGNTQNGILNIAFLSDEEIRVLNRDHRGIDKTTDVLSFHYYDDFSDLGSDDIAGEIILSESRILAQALEHQHSPQKETEILVLHSILHIIGYDHEEDEEYEEMWKWEGELRGKL